ncbi:alpha/beta hydrolase [Campylobacter mucosalis]|uniref:alpha/beta hydrolase n=1 Tax=Campylobacter mucosalis TaxID=202 RepID=UPI0014704013|nr:alpha/beta hydrolase [Campylobacter mucosalis]
MKRRKFIKLAVALSATPLLAQTKENEVKNLANTSEFALKNVAKNPFGLVYKDAITKNVKGEVNIHPVSYESKTGLKIAANVYTPKNYDPNKSYKAIVVAHPNGGVKEQVAGLYAQNLAELGYITIAADAQYQGASGGTPRYVDTPANRTEDIRLMVDFISKFKGVDRDKIGALGICGGGGYTLNAVKTDKRVKAVATISMFNSGLVRRNGFLNSQINTIDERLKDASNAREKEALTGEIEYIKAPNLSDDEIAKLPFDLYREGFIYYGRTHAHPNSSFDYTKSSLLELTSWDTNDQISLINIPLLMIAGDKADTRDMSEVAFKNATNAKDKELFLLKDTTHIESYFKPEAVSQATAKLGEFFGKNL